MSVTAIELLERRSLAYIVVDGLWFRVDHVRGQELGEGKVEASVCFGS